MSQYERRYPDWIVVGTALAMGGILVTVLGYILFWADFESATAIVPEIREISVPLFVVITAAVTIGTVGWRGSHLTATVGSGIYGIFLGVSLLNSGIVWPMPDGSTLILVGMTSLTVLVPIAAWGEHRRQHIYL